MLHFYSTNETRKLEDNDARFKLAAQITFNQYLSYEQKVAFTWDLIIVSAIFAPYFNDNSSSRQPLVALYSFGLAPDW